MPMLRVYSVVNINGFVWQTSIVKKVRGVAIRVIAFMDRWRIETLKSDVITMGVSRLMIKVIIAAVTRSNEARVIATTM